MVSVMPVPSPIEMARDTWEMLRAYPLWVVVTGWLVIAGPLHLFLQPLGAIYFALTGSSPGAELARGRTQAVLGVIALSMAFPPLAMGLAMFVIQ